MTVREMLKGIRKEAKKAGIMDMEIWESHMPIRQDRTLLLCILDETGKQRFYKMGYKMGGEEPIKSVCKKY